MSMISSVSERFFADAYGQVALLGEHTAYSDGVVCSLTPPQSCHVELQRLAGEQEPWVYARHDQHSESVRFVGGYETHFGHWGDYVAATVRGLREGGHRLGAFSAQARSEIPEDCALGATEALQVALMRALAAAYDIPARPSALAASAAWSQQRWLALPTQVYELLACLLGTPRTATMVDCRSLVAESLPLPEELEIVACQARGVRRSYAYHERRLETRQAARQLGLGSLADADASTLARLPELLRRRAAYVVDECQRLSWLAQALRGGDLSAIGELLDGSQRSLVGDYAACAPATDELAQALRAAGALGARATGVADDGTVIAVCERGQGLLVRERLLDVDGQALRWLGHW